MGMCLTGWAGGVGGRERDGENGEEDVVETRGNFRRGEGEEGRIYCDRGIHHACKLEAY